MIRIHITGCLLSLLTFFLGEGDPVHRDGAAVGNPPDGPPALRPAQPRVPHRHGAPRLDPHTAKRTSTALPPGMGTFKCLKWPD